MTPTSTERSPSPSNPLSAILEIDEAELAKLSPEDLAAANAATQALRDLLDANPLNSYFPHQKQKAFHLAKQRTRMVLGGNRSGKTTSGAADDLIQALPPELVPAHLQGFKKFGFDTPFFCRVITPDLSDTLDVVLDKYKEMCPPAALRGGGWDKAYDKVKRNLHFARGDRINFMSTEQDPNKFGGRALHRIHWDEEPAGPNSWRIYRESRQRLIDYGGDMVFSMTPLLETEWVEQTIWEKRLADPDKVFGVQISMRDNPHLSETEIEEALEDLTAEERRAVEHGEFVAFAGKFFDEFTDQDHVRPRPDRDAVRQWDVVVGIDPGDHTGIVWVGFDADLRAFAFDELSPSKKALVPDICDAIKAKNEGWGLTRVNYVIDPAARIGSGPNQENFESAYAREGIFCSTGMNQRGPGIMEIKRRLQKGLAFVSEECPRLRWEISKYRRKPDSQDPFEAVKRDDHEVDAWRYALLERAWAKPKKSRKRRRDNWNSQTYNPNFQPAYSPPRPDSAPMGSFS